jgi:hypothetical protein
VPIAVSWRAAIAICDVTPARSSRELREFRRLPRVLRGADPHWVEPLRTEQARLLDRARHPFYVDGEGATAEFFLARDRRTGQAVGRVAAILCERYNRHRRDSGAATPLQGFFGFFDSIDSLDVTGALLESAARWLRERGAAEMVGPASPSQNYEYGVLIAGHDRPHRYLLAYQPPYYPRLLESAGLEKVKDMMSVSLDLEDPVAWEAAKRWIDRLDAVHRSRQRPITVRPVDMRRLDDEIAIAVRLFNQVLSQHWGHVPLSPGEMADLARGLRHIIIPDHQLFAERQGEPVGILVAIPDMNAAIRRLKLRLGALELVELALRARLTRPDTVRVLLCGVVGARARLAVAPLLLTRFTVSAARLGFRYIDGGWIFEDNQAMLSPVFHAGFRCDRVYRLYRRGLGVTPGGVSCSHVDVGLVSAGPGERHGA